MASGFRIYYLACGLNFFSSLCANKKNSSPFGRRILFWHGFAMPESYILKIFLAFESLTSSNDALYINNLILVSHTSFPKQLVQHLFFKSDNSTFQAFMHNINARNIYFSRKIISKMSSHYVIRMIISLTSYISTCLEISKALEFQIVAD